MKSVTRAFAVAAFALVVVPGAARAAVGVLAVGGDVPDDQKRSFAKSMLSVLKDPVRLNGTCDLQRIDPRCFEQLVAGNKDIDEVVGAVLERAPAAGHTHVVLEVLLTGEWKPTLELEADVPDANASDAAAELVTHAFDPAHYTGTVRVRGAPAGATLAVDGLRVDDEDGSATWKLSVGRHTLEVTRPDGSAAAVPFQVSFRGDTVVDVPAAAAPPPAAGVRWPVFAAYGVAAAGLAAIAVGVPLYTDTDANIRGWHSSAAETRVFLLNNLDPRCQGRAGCDGWQGAYGTKPNAPSSEAAHLAMVAQSLDNEGAWRVRQESAVGLIAAGAVLALTGVVVGTLELVWPPAEAGGPSS